MRCKLVSELPSGDEWGYEVKFDGYRTLAIKEGASAWLISRNEKLLTDRFPSVVAALQKLPIECCVLDGEIVFIDNNGKQSFEALSTTRARNPRHILYYAFDVLNYEGRDVRSLPLRARRELLNSILLTGIAPIHLSSELDADPVDLIALARAQGLEGIIAKRRDSKYESGERSSA